MSKVSPEFRPAKAFDLFNRFRILCALREGPHGVHYMNLLVEQWFRLSESWTGILGAGIVCLWEGRTIRGWAGSMFCPGLVERRKQR